MRCTATAQPRAAPRARKTRLAQQRASISGWPVSKKAAAPQPTARELLLACVYRAGRAEGQEPPAGVLRGGCHARSPLCCHRQKRELKTRARPLCTSFVLFRVFHPECVSVSVRVCINLIPSKRRQSEHESGQPGRRLSSMETTGPNFLSFDIVFFLLLLFK